MRLAAVLLLLVGCARAHLQIHVKGAQPRAGAGVLLAGASRIDLTPPPGYPLGGYSITGAMGAGTYTPILARAIYIEDPSGIPLLLVAADLWSIPEGLPGRVIEILQSSADFAHMGREHVIIAATHNHHSPGAFSTCALYSQFGSYRSGFDPTFFEFIAQRMAHATRAAFRTKRAALIRHSSARVGGLAKNRSLAPFLENPEARDFVASNGDVAGCPETGAPVDPCHAVLPVVNALRLDDAATGNPIAIAAFFASHPTVLAPEIGVYQSDVFGLATTLVEEHLDAEIGTNTVVALFNGAEGDVSPAPLSRDAAGVRELAARLASAIGDAARDPNTSPLAPQVGASLEWIKLSDREFKDVNGTTRRTARTPRVGSGALGGAEDGRTWWFHHGFREGVVRKGAPHPEHGQKKFAPPVIGRFSNSLFPAPDLVPVGVYHIGDIRLATLPGEFTTTMGIRIRNALSAAGRDQSNVILIGHAGGFIQYVTTPEEYTLQHYEGASTLYGPNEGPLFIHELGTLARAKAAPVASTPSVEHYAPGKERAFGYRPGSVSVRELRASEEFLASRFGVTGTTPVLEYELPIAPWPAPDAQDTRPISVIEVKGPYGWHPARVNGLRQSDQTGEFLTVPVQVGKKTWRWKTYWLKSSPGGPDSVRIHITQNSEERCSAAFDPTQPQGTLSITPCR